MNMHPQTAANFQQMQQAPPNPNMYNTYAYLNTPLPAQAFNMNMNMNGVMRRWQLKMLVDRSAAGWTGTLKPGHGCN